MSGKGAFGEDGALFHGEGPVGGRGAATAAPASPYDNFFEGRPINRFAGIGTVLVGTRGYLFADNYGGNIRLLTLARYTAHKLSLHVLSRSPGHSAD